MDTKRMLVSGAVLMALAACGPASQPRGSSEDSEIALARSQIVAGPALCATGRTLNVPSKKYPTIQAALAAAKSGDLVRVTSGTYEECPVLVDGVILAGDPGATLDGTNCGPDNLGVVSADASIVHGATVQGFTIVSGSVAGVFMNGAKGVHVLDVTFPPSSATPPRGIWLQASTGIFIGGCRFEGLGVSVRTGSTAVLSNLDISNARGVSIYVAQSSALLEHSRVAGGGSLRISQGSKAVLVGNDIQAVLGDGVQVQSGNTLSDVGFAPSQAWLADNYIHGSPSSGMVVFGKGSSVYGFGNRYEMNGFQGVQVRGGATYVGRREAMTGNGLGGLFSIGCDLKCSDATCTSRVVIQEQTQVALEEATIDGNTGGYGVFGGCNAQISVRKSTVSHNGTAGARVQNTFVLDADHIGSVSSSLRAEETVFVGHTRHSVTATESSEMLLGTIEDPGRNSFLDNPFGAIRNASTSHVDAQLNWFGTSDAAAIAASIQDCADNPAWGCVTYEPFLTQAVHPQVATPTFSPAAGSYPGDQDVTISCPTSGAQIRYTTDGTTPSGSSSLYAGPIPVAGMGTSVTIRAMATKRGMIDSNGASATYTITLFPSYAFIPLEGSPHDVVYDSSRGRAYVSNRALNRIDVVRVQAHEVEASIPVGGSPRGLAIAPDGQTLLTTIFDTWQMSVIDLDSRSQVSVIDLPPPAYGYGFGPLRVDFDAAGTCIWRDGTDAHAFGNAYILELAAGTSRQLVPTEAQMLRYAPSFDRSKFLLMFNWGQASVWTSASQGSSTPVSIPGFSGDWWNWMNQGAINDSGEINLLSTYGATKVYDAGFNYLGSTADMAWATFGPWSHLALVVPGSDEVATGTVSLVDFGSIRTVDSLVLPERIGYGEYNFGGQPIFLTADAKRLFLVGQTGLFIVDTSAITE